MLQQLYPGLKNILHIFQRYIGIIVSELSLPSWLDEKDAKPNERSAFSFGTI